MENNQIISYCRKIIEQPAAHILNAKKEQKYRYVGYSCTFIPEPLFHAAGFIPVRIFGYKKRLTIVEKYLPGNCCEFSRSLMETMLSDSAGFCDAFVFAHCCDTLREVADLVTRLAARRCYLVNIPAYLSVDSTTGYLDQELVQLKLNLEKDFDLEITREALLQSWAVYRENFSLMEAFNATRSDKPGIISGTDSMILLLAGLFMPKEEHNTLLKQVIANLNAQEYAPGKTTKKILISGMLNGSIKLMELIEKSGCIVVSDELCETSRRIPVSMDPFEKEMDFPRSLAHLLLSMYCPVKYHNTLTYDRLLLEKNGKAGADGIIFLLFPFCDAQPLAYASVKQHFKARGIKSLVLEIIIGDSHYAALQTRLEAFLESL